MGNKNVEVLRLVDPNIKISFSVSEDMGGADVNDKTRKAKVNMLAYTGKKIVSCYEYENLVLDLEGMQNKPNTVIPLLYGHWRQDKVGVVSAITTGADGLNAVGEVFLTFKDGTENEVGKDIYNFSSMGFPWQASVGVVISKKRTVDKEETVIVNGITYTNTNFVIAEKFKINEISICEFGADDDTEAKIEAKRILIKKGKLEKEFNMNSDELKIEDTVSTIELAQKNTELTTMQAELALLREERNKVRLEKIKEVSADLFFLDNDSPVLATLSELMLENPKIDELTNMLIELKKTGLGKEKALNLIKGTNPDLYKSKQQNEVSGINHIDFQTIFSKKGYKYKGDKE